ncbi:MAG: 23S rRNA (pseudouridine(1915)-N(3))-methyltransferase RlmH [bacterium]
MLCKIACIGLLKKGPILQVLQDYQQRTNQLSRSIGLKGIAITEMEAPAKLPALKKQEKEASLLAAAIPPGASIFVLDEKGQAYNSAKFAARLGALRDQGQDCTAFVIGGADGHGPAIRNLISSGRAQTLAFGPATWPHLLVRVMLAEQIYRAMTIMANHPYHRE